MAGNNYREMLEEYALPKLNGYSETIEDLLGKRIVAVMGSFNEEELQRQRQVNLEMYSKLKAGSLEALVILEGNKEKFEACLDLALSRNRTVDCHGPYADGYLTLLTSINVDSFCSEVKSFAYLLEEKDTEDYIKKNIQAFDKKMEECGLEVKDLEPDKLPKKRKK